MAEEKKCTGHFPSNPVALTRSPGSTRDGRCVTGPQDSGKHVICAQVTEEFLRFSQGQGNDLINPVAAYDFPGLKPGDRWCLCASRWQEAYDAGMAPPVVLEATHKAALQYVSMEALREKGLNDRVKE